MSWMLLMFACESMSNPGKPFSSVAMLSTQQVMGGTTTSVEDTEEISDEFKDPQEIIELNDEDIAEAVEPMALTETVTSTAGQTITIDATQTPQTIITPEMRQGSGLLPAQTIVTQEIETVAIGGPAVAMGGATGWPVRLVGTMSDAQPPRAVLGFASGEEVVVTPGMLLPAHQLVVMSVGVSQVQLAKIVPMGDRAVIQSMSLQAAYPE